MRRFFFGLRSSPPVIAPDGDQSAPATCPRCGADLKDRPRYLAYRVCDDCNAHLAISARKRLHALLDEDSFRETNRQLYSTDPLRFADSTPYAERLEEQQRQTGESDALITGTGAIHGRKVVVAVLDFAFMGGSMGVVVGEKLVRAVEQSIETRRPLLTIVASGGARMQEGMLSLFQMAKTAAAIQRLHAAGIPYISVLTHPTTGGVFASFANLGDLIVAEPGALIGFAGPRVVEQFLGRPLPPGSHSAEFLLAHGLIDAIVSRPDLRDYVGQFLEVLEPRGKRERPAGQPPTARPDPPEDAWETIVKARAPDRPTSLDYIDRLCDRFVELRGDRQSGDDPAIVAGLGVIGGHPVAVIGMERGHGEESEHRRLGRPMPEGFRKAQRVMRLGARLGLPVVTLIDTPGAYPGIEAEERGLAREIARSMALMSDLPTPTISIVIGEGGSGGALALAVADRLLMQEGAVFSVIAPEGAAAILYRDASRAPELAAKLRITAVDLKEMGLIDEVIPEPEGGAAADPDSAAALVRMWLLHLLTTLTQQKRKRLLESRYARLRQVGRAFTATRPPKHAREPVAASPNASASSNGGASREASQPTPAPAPDNPGSSS
ncbi:MAG TPA: acetyl-CoA carboxylase, carboxyltransferase subunit beta [Thermomicrobiales bacterium]